jgi:hypothetical protein
MKSIDNPYNPGSGKPPPELAGRGAVLTLARSSLERAKAGRSSRDIILLGLRGVGKTVLLVEFEKMAEAVSCQATNVIEADYDRPLPQLLVPQLFRILIRLDRVKRAKQQAETAWSTLRAFASAFKIKIGDVEVQVAKSSATGDLAMDLSDLFMEMGQAARAAETAVVILIDEVQCLDSGDLSALIMALHKVAQRQLPIVFIGAGLPQLPKLAGEAKSYAERMFHNERIDRLDEASATAAIVEPAKAASVTFTPEAVASILHETQGYPYYLQEWGKHAWDVAASSPITAKDVDEARKLAIATLDNGIFASRLQRLTDRQLDYARAMADLSLPARSTDVAAQLGMTPEQTAQMRDELIKKGIAYSPKRGLIDFTIPLFDACLRRNIAEPRRQRPPGPGEA